MALLFSDAKRIPITDYLSKAGFEPARVRGHDHWYHSPFRHERTPSLKVNTKLNVWYDHGSGEGGTILDLGAKLHRCSIAEFLEKLTNGNYLFTTTTAQNSSRDTQENKLEIVNTRELSNSDLTKYLLSRGIKPHFAYQFCREVEFRIAGKYYVAIGFQNRSGGYELRNRWFKGSSSPKDVSVIEGSSNSLYVTEGFIDFLSVLTLNHQAKIELPVNPGFLILNSLSFLNRSLPLLSNSKENILFLDNDLAGKDARKVLTLKGISFQDASHFYAPYKDVNEFLVKDPKAMSTLARPKGIRY